MDSKFNYSQLKTIAKLVYKFLDVSYVFGVCSAVCEAWEEAALEHSPSFKITHYIASTLALPNINYMFCLRLGNFYGLQPKDYLLSIDSIIANNYYELAEMILPRVGIDYVYGACKYINTQRMACTVMMLDNNPYLDRYGYIDETVIRLAWVINNKINISFILRDDKFLDLVMETNRYHPVQYNGKNPKIVELMTGRKEITLI